jgi:hypothetical protein
MAIDGEPLPVTTSTPPEFLPEAVECYTGVLQSLRESRIPHAIAGAFALHRHTGIWRATKDMDVFLEARSIPDTLLRLEKLGFRTHIEDPVWLAKAWRGEYFVDLITAVGNAALIVDESWLARAKGCELLGMVCPVLEPEEIIATKVFVSRRERFDGADIVHLIRWCGARMDWERLEYLLADHWELLLWALAFYAYVYPAHLDVVPETVWTGQLRRLEQRVKDKARDGLFRGTLIDPFMFRVDAAEWGDRDLYREFRESYLASREKE